MCGIAGMIDLNDSKRPAPRGAVQRMSQAIIHRGPDEEGSLDREGLHLANRRLSIVGLADGQQPISNEDGTIWTVFNGEFFDYPEQRKKLEAKGHTFKTHTDTEILPHLWEEHRAGMLEHLSGQFAFCIWDSKTNEFLIARDRPGICPLFYTTKTIDGTDWLLFASEMKALFASGFVQPKADLQGLNHIFTFFAMPGPITVFDGITMLMPGHYLHFKPGSVNLTQRPYWQVSYPDQGQEVYGHDEKKLVRQYEDVLFDAVTKRLRADVPVVSYLSGGVDSSLVVAMASKALGRPIPTFTVAVQREGMNEELEALATAKHLGCDPIVVNCGADELRNHYPELIGAAEFPVIDTSCVGLMQLARAVGDAGYKVALTGEGADEWLGGYPWFKIHRMTGWMDKLPGIPLGYWVRKLGMKALRNPMYPRSLYHHVQKFVGGPNGWLDSYGLMSVNKLRFFAPELKTLALKRSPYEDLQLTPDLHRWHPFHRQMYLGARIMLPGHLLASKGDRVAMHSSVETRYAFLDEKLTDLTATLHPRWKLRGIFKDKLIERKVAERWLPKDVAWRRKRMFRAPMDSWGNVGAGATDKWIDEVLSPEALRKTGYFDVEAVVSARQKLLRPGRGVGRTGLEMGMTAVVATQLWHRIYIDGESV